MTCILLSTSNIDDEEGDGRMTSTTKTTEDKQAKLGFEIDDDFTPVQDTGQGRRSELDLLLDEIGKLPVKAYVEDEAGFRKDLAGLKHSQQVVIPTKDPETGQREPVVTSTQFKGLVERNGKNSVRHHRDGFYFHLELSHTRSVTNPGSNTSQKKGVLVVYKVEAKTDGPPPKK